MDPKKRRSPHFTRWGCIKAVGIPLTLLLCILFALFGENALQTAAVRYVFIAVGILFGLALLAGLSTLVVCGVKAHCRNPDRVLIIVLALVAAAAVVFYYL